MDHMLIKGGTPYFRTRIPLRLAKAAGRSEIRLSLKTSDLQKAATICKLLYPYLQKVFKTMADEKRTFTLKDLEERLDEIANFLLFSMEGWIFDRTHSQGKSPDVKTHIAAELDQMIAKTRQSIIDDDNTVAELDFLTCGPTGMNFENLWKMGPEACETLVKKYYQKRIYILQVLKEHLQGNYDTEYDRKHGNSMVDPNKTLFAKSVAETKQERPPVNPLSSITQEFISFKISSGEWTAKTRISRETVLKLLVEHFGENCDPASITPTQMMDFRERVLRHLPARRNVDPVMRDKKLDELLTEKSPRLLSIATINDYMTVCSSFFQWGVKFKDWLRNPASGLLLHDNKSAEEKRSLYSQADIENIFRHWNDLPNNTDNRRSRNTQFGWIVLIAAFSGMRQNEICQLSVDDVVLYNGVPCFAVRNNHPTKSIKNPQSRRLVPIHPELLRYGFLSFVDQQRALPEAVVQEGTPSLRQLFPCCIWNEVGHYNRNFERAFTKYNEEYVTTDSLKKFHSLRHNVATMLSNLEGVESHQVSRILGHAQTTETNRTYAKTDIERLRAILSRMRYDCDPFLLMGMAPLNEEEVNAQTSRLPVLEMF